VYALKLHFYSDFECTVIFLSSSAALIVVIIMTDACYKLIECKGEFKNKTSGREHTVFEFAGRREFVLHIRIPCSVLVISSRFNAQLNPCLYILRSLKHIFILPLSPLFLCR
jgi:hypothetical protein